MTQKIRVGTFNVENLFARYNFRKNVDPTSLDGFSINDLAFNFYDETSKQITAKTIREVNADILCLQEVENLAVLDRFNSRYLASRKYKHRFLVDAFDPRKIDVAILSKHPIISVRSYRQERNKKNTACVFSRDCLELIINVNGKLLTLYNNHFKSMMYGRDKTHDRRLEQVEKVASIITDNHAGPSGNEFNGNYIVLGDFNDYIGDDNNGKSSLPALLNHPGLVNVCNRIPEEERWSHYWAGGNEYRMIDFMLLSPELAAKNSTAPEVFRKGLPWKAEDYTGNRYDTVGQNSPKASDHCPVFMDLELV